MSRIVAFEAIRALVVLRCNSEVTPTRVDPLEPIQRYISVYLFESIALRV